MKFINRIIPIFLLKISYIFLAENNLNYIRNLENVFCNFLDLYVDSVRKQLLENLKYDLHLLSINNINETENSLIQILKCIPMKKFDLKFLITSYNTNQFVSNFSIFSFYEEKTCSLIEFKSTEKNITRNDKKIFILNIKSAYSFIEKFIMFFEKIFKSINNIFTENDGIFIIQPIKTSEYEKNTMNEILRNHNYYFYLNLVVIIQKKRSSSMKDNIICNQNSITENIRKYIIFRLEYEFIIGFIKRIKCKIQSISLLNSDFNSKILQKIYENSKSTVSPNNLLNKSDNRQNEFIKFRVNQYIIIKYHRIMASHQKVKELCFYSISKISRINEKAKTTKIYSLDLFLYKVKIKRSIHSPVDNLNDQIKYDFKITIEKHLTLYPDMLMFKIITTWNFLNDYYNVKNVLLNFMAKDPSEFKELIESIIKNTKE